LSDLLSVPAIKPSGSLRTRRSAVHAILAAHRASNARVFGSVARGVDDELSDLDIRIDPTPDTTLLDIGAIRHELRKLLGVSVDVLTPNALPVSFRDAVCRPRRRPFEPGSSTRRR
jgi:predicted nucleotidyltransferase